MFEGRTERVTMKTYKDWICRYYSEHEDGEPDGVIINELIWCEDCKHNSNVEGNFINCDIIPQMFGKTPDNNYCSYAEPKEQHDH